MPIFEFKCPQCSTKFEKILPKLRRSHKCPKCGASANKLLSLPQPPIFAKSFDDNPFGVIPEHGIKYDGKQIVSDPHREI